MEQVEQVKQCIDVTWDEVDEWCGSIAQDLTEEQWIPDVIVGVARGGLVPAARIAYLAGTKVVLGLAKHDMIGCALDLGYFRRHYFEGHGKHPLKVLVVDDINDSGNTLTAVDKALNEHFNVPTLSIKPDIRYAVLLNKADVSSFKSISFYGFAVTAKFSQDYWPYNDESVWWVFPWERQYGQETLG